MYSIASTIQTAGVPFNLMDLIYLIGGVVVAALIPLLVYMTAVRQAEEAQPRPERERERVTAQGDAGDTLSPLARPRTAAL